jgi:hypothetical protein
MVNCRVGDRLNGDLNLVINMLNDLPTTTTLVLIIE